MSEVTNEWNEVAGGEDLYFSDYLLNLNNLNLQEAIPASPFNERAIFISSSFSL